MKKLTQKQNKEACQFFLKLATALGLVTVFGLIVTQNKGILNIKNVKKPSLPSIGSPPICPSCNEPTNGDNIPDDPPATPIVGQSGTIIDLNGLPGSGKSPFALTLTSEACDGAPYGLLSDNSGKPLPPFKCIWYHTERDIKFKAHYGEKLTQLGERIKLFKECRFSNMDAFIKSLEGSIAKANDNCCIIIDTPSSLLNTDELKLNGVRRFINELKRVRAHSNKQGHTITFIIVTHKTPSSGGVRGSSV
ncbi:MAG: AAA family ATPase [Muribaculum sp.]|nr:AAA family ATPase [Muribaculum sp.]